MATLQLRLHYAGKKSDHGSPQDSDCTTERITIIHIAWECQRAQDFWKRCLKHWYGREVTKEDLEAHKAFSASRKTVINMKNTVIKWYGNWRKEFVDAFIRIWWAMNSIGVAMLWQIRNQVDHEGKDWTRHQQLGYMWANLLRQLRAVSRRELSKPATRVAGLHLHLCLDYFATRDAVKAETNHHERPRKKTRRPNSRNG